MAGQFNGNAMFTDSDLNSGWDNENMTFDSSAFVNFSPQLHSQSLTFPQDAPEQFAAPANSRNFLHAHSQDGQAPPSQAPQQPRTLPHNPQSNTSSASGEDSSGSSISPFAARNAAPYSSATSQQPGRSQTTPLNSQGASRRAEENATDFINASDPRQGQESVQFQHHDSSMRNDMDNLSLQPDASFDFGATATPGGLAAELFATGTDEFPDTAFDDNNMDTSLQSPVSTVQPNRTFFLGESRDESPNEVYTAERESPSLAFVDNSLPQQVNSSSMNTGVSGPSNIEGMTYGAWNAMPSDLQPSVNPQAFNPSTSQWSSQITFDPLPEKSRVETQIPIRITLHNPPPGFKRIHLPTYTISKPKFQIRPRFQGASDTLELHTLLVCSSAMRNKLGAVDRALKRAAAGEVPMRKVKVDPNKPDEIEEEEPPGEDNPARPLNGGSVSVCVGCMQRERKRAARKKTKKHDEESEWSQDEAKRVVVFNCAELKDWCLPEGNKETPVREQSTNNLQAMTVYLPMRIACYCRHQQEKVGFRVIFTLKTSSGVIVTQAMSPSIMITDDHKQPIPQPGPLTYAPAGSVDQQGNFFPLTRADMMNVSVQAQAQAQAQAAGRDLPFRPSQSTPDLRHLQGQFAPQNVNLARQSSSVNLVMQQQPNTASATPRNLSRPASPTLPAGQPGAKKRRSGGSTNRIPSNLHMTSLETVDTNAHTSAGSGLAGFTSAPSSATFDFTPGTNGFGSTPLDSSMAQASLRTPTNFASGPSTPLHPPTSHFMNEIDPSQFYSAPTSQHGSRAPSPGPTSRMQYGPPGIHGQPAQSVPEGALDALRALPPGINLARPPILQRLIPARSARSGGEEVTVLGTGFFQGLEVMFGDQPATNTVFWGETTLVCRAPPARTPGIVPVCFKHQHRTAPPQIRELQTLTAARTTNFTYIDDSAMRAPMHQHQHMVGLQQPAAAYPNQGTHSGIHTPTGNGSVSPPNVGSGGSMEDLNSGTINPRAYMGHAHSPSSGPGSAGFNAASFARSQQAQQEAVQAVAAQRRMAPARTVSGGQGLNR
ncbi:MAG: hypothetical protein Q9159_004053 [Coniocarpon cinnabarinum]